MGQEFEAGKGSKDKLDDYEKNKAGYKAQFLSIVRKNSEAFFRNGGTPPAEFHVSDLTTDKDIPCVDGVIGDGVYRMVDHEVHKCLGSAKLPLGNQAVNTVNRVTIDLLRDGSLTHLGDMTYEVVKDGEKTGGTRKVRSYALTPDGGQAAAAAAYHRHEVAVAKARARRSGYHVIHVAVDGTVSVRASKVSYETARAMKDDDGVIVMFESVAKKLAVADFSEVEEVQGSLFESTSNEEDE